MTRPTEEHNEIKVVGVVVLYHPDEETYANICTYLPNLEVLYALDNTENPEPGIAHKIAELPNVKYIPFHDNKGLSYALNYALNQANGQTFLLTMDQDSAFPPYMLDRYISSISDMANRDDIAMFAVNYTGLKEAKNLHGSHFVKAAITSGSMVNVDIARKIGGFDENLFIDEVDDEFCYRAGENGFKILLMSDIKLTHHLGNPRQYNILGYRFTVLNHSPIRKYYIVRNRLYVAQKYPFIRRYYEQALIKMFVKVLFFESDKLAKLKLMLEGIRDFHHHCFGKYKYMKAKE